MLGLWMARVLNPLYYLNMLRPYWEPYAEAVERLFRVLVTDKIPGYYFLKGFFSEYYGYITTILLGVVTVGFELALDMGYKLPRGGFLGAYGRFRRHFFIDNEPGRRRVSGEDPGRRKTSGLMFLYGFSTLFILFAMQYLQR
jgi:hypothetical protein